MFYLSIGDLFLDESARICKKEEYYFYSQSPPRETTRGTLYTNYIDFEVLGGTTFVHKKGNPSDSTLILQL